VKKGRDGYNLNRKGRGDEVEVLNAVRGYKTKGHIVDHVNNKGHEHWGKGKKK